MFFYHLLFVYRPLLKITLKASHYNVFWRHAKPKLCQIYIFFCKLVLFGPVGGNWWDLFCGGTKLVKQYGSFLHGIYKYTFVGPKLLFLFINSAYVQKECLINYEEVTDSWKKVVRNLQAQY